MTPRQIQVLFYLYFLLFTSIQAQQYEWAKSFGNSSNGFGRSIAVDDFGNIYTTGSFNDTVDFDPGPGILNLTATGSSADIYIHKMDSSGNMLWAKSFGGASHEVGNSIAVDAFGNVYIVGYFEGTVDFDPGSGTANNTAAGMRDAFIQKLDPWGNFLWVKTFGNTNRTEAFSIVVDVFGSVYTTGDYVGTLDFDPGPGVFNLTASVSDCFIQKLDSLGNFCWAKSFGGTLFTSGTSITLDAFGNIYTTGYFGQTTDFDPGSGTHNISSNGNSDIFIQKLDSAGNFVWAKGIGGYNHDYGNSIAVDASGNVYTTGLFRETVKFNPGMPNWHQLTAAGGNPDGFILKLDSAGNFSWVKQDGSINFFSTGNSIVLDTSGNVYTAGFYQLDFLVQKLDTAGNILWENLWPNSGVNANFLNRSITTDGFGNIYATNGFRFTEDFNHGIETDNRTSAGNNDAFILKLSPCPSAPSTGTDRVVACESFTWLDGNTYTSSNYTATTVVTSARGCDSLLYLDLTINRSSTGIDTIETCSSFTWIDGITYTNSNNTATTTLMNSVGCDSIVHLDLTITREETIDSITTCKSYTWVDGITYTQSNNTATQMFTSKAGCDSVVRLDLTINRDTSIESIVACDSYTWIDGNTYTESSDTATQMFTSKAGCDSVVRLDLTITKDFSVDTIVACDRHRWINGITYTQSNYTATYKLVNQFGCDSTVYLNLTINPSPPKPNLPSEIFLCGFLNIKDLHLNQSNYKWYDTKTSQRPLPNNTFLLDGTEFYVGQINPNTQCEDSTKRAKVSIKISEFDTTTFDVAACKSFFWDKNGVTYNNTGLYYHTIPRSNGCDSLLELNLWINDTALGAVQQIESCGPYLWPANNKLYQKSGLYTTKLSNADSCNPIAGINLTVYPRKTSTIKDTACDIYYWDVLNSYIPKSGVFTKRYNHGNNCDSIAILELQLNRKSETFMKYYLCASDSIELLDKTYFAPGVYRETVSAINGCDSIITLTIENYEPELSLLVSNDSILPVQKNVDVYWMQCLNGAFIDMNLKQVALIRPDTGYYAARLVNGSCIDTTSCIYFQPTTIDIHTGQKREFTVFPNPNNGTVNVEFDALSTDVELTLTDIQGKVVFNKTYAELLQTTLTLPKEAGIYNLIIQTNQNQSVVKLIRL